MTSTKPAVGLGFAMVLACGIAHAQWPAGPDSSLQVYASDVHRSSLLSVASDGVGGAFLSWRTGVFFECPWYSDGVTIQRVTASGAISWGATGIRVSSDGTQPAIMPDGQGGVIVVWKNQPSLQSSTIYYNGIHAQRFDATGTPLWGPGSVVSNFWEYATWECSGLQNWPFPRNPVVVPTLDGGAFIAWQAGAEVRAQRITATGEPAWGSSGRLVGYWGLQRTWANAVADGWGGLIVVWTQLHSTFAQRIDADGTLAWGDSLSGAVVGPGFNEYQQPAVASDDSGGVIVTWTDHRDGWVAPYDIYAQRVDRMGRVRWTTAGVQVCSRARTRNLQPNPVMVSDGEGGAVIAWPDSRDSCDLYGYSCQIVAQRVSRAGVKLWAPGGVLLSGAPDTVTDCAIGIDDEKSAIVAWTRWLDGSHSNQIWAQRVDSDGQLGWGESGRMVANSSPSRRSPQILADDVRGTIIAWVSGVSPYGGLVEAQQIPPSTRPSFMKTASLFAAPNPTRGAATLNLELSHSGRGMVAIHDLVGRRVRLLYAGDLDAGQRWIVWDGRDDAGNRVRPGVYFARMAYPGAAATGRIVLLP